MMGNAAADGDDHVDATADEIIAKCLQLESPKSFFLFAGAGSGKTRSLTIALAGLLDRERSRLRLHRQQIGAITYTNAACDEILRRLDYDPLVEVSTIHSFVWSRIKGFHKDIRAWLEQRLRAEVAELEERERKGRAGKASLDRQRSIQVKNERLAALPSIKRFSYNPNGDNVGFDSLSHAEVIAIGSDFLTDKPLMQSILVNKFPVILVDESQDTHGPLMEALLTVQDKHKGKFALGLMGDMMQRIYGHGKPDLGDGVPKDWGTPEKVMNHRSPRRIVELVNRIRQPVDGRIQRARSDQPEGIVRLFLAKSDTSNADEIENLAKSRMAEITSDEEWASPEGRNKILILEHHMAAARLGFSEMFEPLYRVDRFRTGLLDGSLSGLRIFSEQVLPLVKARQLGDRFSVAAIVRKHSDLLSKRSLKQAGADQLTKLNDASGSVEEVFALWRDGNDPRFIDVLRKVAATKLFTIPESIRPIVPRTEAEQETVEKELSSSDKADEKSGASDLTAWDRFMLGRFSQIEPYREYVQGLAAFHTHQGVKGREFDRVMVIIDDSAARGFMFSYDKLFGAKPKSDTDLKHEQENKETGLDRTRRLLYVTCSRAQKSLALVLYASDPELVRQHVLKEGWFQEEETELV